jgi:hypothetical protein
MTCSTLKLRRSTTDGTASKVSVTSHTGSIKLRQRASLTLVLVTWTVRRVFTARSHRRLLHALLDRSLSQKVVWTVCQASPTRMPILSLHASPALWELMLALALLTAQIAPARACLTTIWTPALRVKSHQSASSPVQLALKTWTAIPAQHAPPAHRTRGPKKGLPLALPVARVALRLRLQLHRRHHRHRPVSA